MVISETEAPLSGTVEHLSMECKFARKASHAEPAHQPSEPTDSTKKDADFRKRSIERTTNYGVRQQRIISYLLNSFILTTQKNKRNCTL
jgi:hypothetical protein